MGALWVFLAGARIFSFPWYSTVLSEAYAKASMWDLSPAPFVQTFRLLPPLRPSPAGDGMLGVLLSGAAKNEEPSDLCGCRPGTVCPKGHRIRPVFLYLRGRLAVSPLLCLAATVGGGDGDAPGE